MTVTQDQPFRAVRSSAESSPAQFEPVKVVETTDEDTVTAKSAKTKGRSPLNFAFMRKGFKNKKSSTLKSQADSPPQSRDESSPTTAESGPTFAQQITGLLKGKKKSSSNRMFYMHNTQLMPSDRTPQNMPAGNTPALPDKPATIRFTEPNRYFIEYYKDLQAPLEFGEDENVNMRHAVMIHQCSNCTIKINRKVNKVELDNCNKVTIILPAVIASVDLHKCHSCNIHVSERLPGASIDNCSSVQIYVPRESMDHLEVASSGGGSANLLVPKLEDPTEFDEIPIPFQYVHKFKDGKLMSQVSPLYTH